MCVPSDAARKPAATVALRITRADDGIERRELSEIDVVGERRALAAGGSATARPLRERRLVEVDDELESARERRVDVLAEVRREDRQAVEALEAREQIRRLEVGVAVVGVRDLGAPAEERVGLVEEAAPPGALRGVEDLREVLLRLADPLRDDARDVHDEEVDAERVREDLGGQRLAGAGRAGEQHADAARAGASLEEAPVVEDDALMPEAVERLVELQRAGRAEARDCPSRDGVDELHAGRQESCARVADARQHIDRRRRSAVERLDRADVAPRWRAASAGSTVSRAASVGASSASSGSAVHHTVRRASVESGSSGSASTGRRSRATAAPGRAHTTTGPGCARRRVRRCNSPSRGAGRSSTGTQSRASACVPTRRTASGDGVAANAAPCGRRRPPRRRRAARASATPCDSP